MGQIPRELATADIPIDMRRRGGRDGGEKSAHYVLTSQSGHGELSISPVCDRC